MDWLYIYLGEDDTLEQSMTTKYDGCDQVVIFMLK